MDTEQKKRVTITLEGKTLKWIDQKISERVFHNFQHAVDYCVMRTYQREYKRYSDPKIYPDHVTLFDFLQKTLVDIQINDYELYCTKCKTNNCEHIKHIYNKPEINEHLKNKSSLSQVSYKE